MEKSGRSTRIVPETALLFAGISGILMIFGAIPQITFSKAAVFLANAFVCAGMCALYSVRRKWILRGAAAVLLLSAAALGLSRGSVSVQLSALTGSIRGAAEAECTDVTLVLLLISCMLSACFFVLEIVWERHLLPYAAVTAFMAGAPLFGIHPGIPCALLCLAFQILFWVMRAQAGHKAPVSMQSGIFVSALLAVFVCISAFLTSFWGEELSGAVYLGEGFLSRSAQHLTGRAEEPSADGRVSSGNVYRTGDVQLEVTVSEKPSQTLYLKGFAGGRYIGGEWEEANDEIVFRQMANVLGWERWDSWIRTIYNTLYFIMNQASAEDVPEPQEITLVHTDNSYRTLYTPYYGGRMEQREEGGYGYHFFDISQMHLDWEYASANHAMISGWMRQVRDAYQQAIGDFYTEVPEEMLPNLVQLCSEHPAGSQEEATAYILSVLQENASYTLTPGRAPLNGDVVEYFLFENHEGYCVHFASAAALMYRLWGIPARYVSGYAAVPSDFVQQTDGSWHAEVTDASAHAWTEIFLADYGWTPVEFTPASDGSIEASYPGLDARELADLLGSVNLRVYTAPGETDEKEVSVTASDQNGWGGLPELPEIFISRSRVIAAAAGSICVIPLVLELRRRRRRRQIGRMNCREVFGRLMEMLHFAGYLTDCIGSEEDFAERLAAEAGVLQEDAQRLTAIVSRAAYGREAPYPEEAAFVREFYFRAGERLDENLIGFKRFVFRYAKAFF